MKDEVALARVLSQGDSRSGICLFFLEGRETKEEEEVRKEGRRQVGGGEQRVAREK